MIHHRIVGTLAIFALLGIAGSHAHEVRPACGLAITEEQNARDSATVDLAQEHTADDFQPAEFCRTHRQVSRILHVGLQDRHGP
jgi:hypothetical protein